MRLKIPVAHKVWCKSPMSNFKNSVVPFPNWHEATNIHADGLTWFPHKGAVFLYFKESLNLQNKILNFTYIPTRKPYYKRHIQKEKLFQNVQNIFSCHPVKHCSLYATSYFSIISHYGRTKVSRMDKTWTLTPENKESAADLHSGMLRRLLTMNTHSNQKEPSQYILRAIH